MNILSQEQFEALYTYIQEARQFGLSDKIIVEELKKNGWGDQILSFGFDAIAHGHFETLSRTLHSERELVISLRNIEKVYENGGQQTYALNNISLNVERGDFVVIMGPSGSGKSTLMHILGLLDTPSFGSYHLSNHEASDLKSSERAVIRNRKIGFVFQQFNLLPRTTVLDNILLPTIYGTVSGMHDRAKNILERVGLTEHMYHKSNQLSGGQIQRVAIARALMMEPDIILADEPTGNLDSVTSEGIIKLFKEINNMGTTVIMVTHEDHIASHAKRIVRLLDGDVITDERIV